MAVKARTGRYAFCGRSHEQAGFGLIELITTIVILGVLFIMTLRGSEIVTTMRAFVTSRQIEQYFALIQAYREEYGGALPGDDPRARGRFRREPALGMLGGSLIDETGNERIDGRLSDYSSPDGEQFAAWRDLRYAGMLKGDPRYQGAAAMPDNVFGGVFGFDVGNLGQTSTSLCTTKVPGRAAEMIDQRLDDGQASSGKIVATSKYSAEAANHFDSPDTGPYHIEKEYIICAQLQP